MHIPDGYLSPQTCATAYAVAVPFWATATRRVTKVVKSRSVPMLAVLSALSFLIMMFNVPIPNGTTAHAVGAVVIAILLGPWAAVIAVSVALLFQALLFGDGGVLAYGANVVNMAILMPFVGYGVYRALAGNAPLTARRRVWAAAIAGYAGINAAGIATAIELGIQPDLFHTAAGAPLYSPYHISQALPPMLLAHLTLAGAAEAILSGGLVAYLQRADVAKLVPGHPGIALHADEAARPARWSPRRVSIAFLAVMAALSPLGLLAPGGAFGEDAPNHLDLGKYGLRAVPSGLERYNAFWSHKLLDGYGFGSGDHPTIAYLVSAFLGIAVTTGAVFLLAKGIQALARRRQPAAAGSRS